jgi:hypothetical protein
MRRFMKFVAAAVVLGLVFALLGFHTGPPRVKAQGSSSIPETPQAVFTNSTAIAFNTGAANNGTPYGTAIVASGLPTILPATPGALKVTINNFSHTFPDDVGLVLVGPTGAALLVQDECGDDPNIVGVTYTISDDGATQLPDLTVWTGGTYRPTAHFHSNSFPAPGPLAAYQYPSPYGGGTATLGSTFGGTNPNGTWTLYTRDFATGDGGSIAGGWSLTFGGAVVANHPVMDFDGDGKSDDVVTRNVGGNLTWYFLNGAGFSGFPFGLAGSDMVVPGDYDGDFKWDVAVWRSGIFYILQSSTNTLRTQPFGDVGDDPRSTQDYDGDGKADPTVVRNVGGNLTFYILRSSLGFTGVTFGTAFDVPLRGDYDGDGKADVAVYRKNSGTPANTFFIIPSTGGPLIARTFGIYDLDFIVPVDFDGDHKTDFAVWRGVAMGTDSVWYWLRSTDGAFKAQAFGNGNGDRPVVGDYDGDGISDQAIWRPGVTATFYHLGSTAGVTGANFGTTGDTPVAVFQYR